MSAATLTLRNAGGEKTVHLAEYLDPSAEERAHEAAYHWIKALRHLEVEGLPLRDRFVSRGDSLWWFTELYLHKGMAITGIHRTIHALQAVIDREAPGEITVASGSTLVRHVAGRLAAERRIRTGAAVGSGTWMTRLAQLDLRARRLTLTALATADRWKGGKAPTGPVTVAAFVHRAFWRSGTDGSAESYMGPILAELEQRLGPQAVRYVGIGPTTNFRTPRRWRGGRTSAIVIPVERFASWRTLAEARATWRRRYANFRVLTRAETLREAARIQGVDCWPIVREQLAGIAWLQWPWSVRTMDEAAAALDSLEPSAVATYAEAGGWGRALILEARRRGIPSVGLQHGFIYRHWLNYRHESDEILPGRRTAPFPYPTRTLLFDDHAARHLTSAGHLPPESLRITGSPGRDALAQQIEGVTRDKAAAVRQQLGIGAATPVLLVATKEKEARASLGSLIEAAATIPDLALVIKPHPAETAGVYETHARGRRHVTIAPPSCPLAELLALARAVATINSTVAIDAASLGIPALSFGLPNNLSPFVEAGAMAGSPDPADLPGLLRLILYDEGFRQQLAGRGRRTFGEPSAGRGAAASSAAAIIELIT
jgi:hypothetical protein